MDLRCEHTMLHGIMVEPFVLEIRCRCKAGRDAGDIILHRFDTRTGEMMQTVSYRNPNRSK